MQPFITPIKPMEFTGSTSAAGSAPQGQGASFSDLFSNALHNLEEVTQTANQDSVNLALGDVDDLAQLQINAMKAHTMLQTTVQVTTRIVNAYKEIMQMQV